MFSFKLRGAYNKMAHLTAAERAKGVIAASAGQPRAGRRARRAAPRLPGDDRDAGHHAAHQDRARSRRAARPWCCTATRIRMRTNRRSACRRSQRRHVRAPVRRSRRDRRAGHDRHGDPAPMPGAARRHLRRGRRRRPHLRASPRTSSACGRRSRIIGVQPVDSDAMTRSLAAAAASRCRTWASSPTAWRSSRSAARRSGSCAPHVDEMMTVDTDATCAAIKDVFEDTRSILEPAGALSVAGVKAWCERHRVQGPHVRRHRLRRQHELRPAALRRRARGAGRGARGDLRGHHPRAAGQLPRVLRAARQPQRDRVQLSLRRREGRAPVRRRRGGRTGKATARAAGGVAQAPHRGLRPVRQRDGEAARAPPGRRPRAGRRATRSCTASSFPSGRAP